MNDSKEVSEEIKDNAPKEDSIDLTEQNELDSIEKNWKIARYGVIAVLTLFFLINTYLAIKASQKTNLISTNAIIGYLVAAWVLKSYVLKSGKKYKNYFIVGVVSTILVKIGLNILAGIIYLILL